jgi:hypothetical protein
LILLNDFNGFVQRFHWNSSARLALLPVSIGKKAGRNRQFWLLQFLHQIRENVAGRLEIQPRFLVLLGVIFFLIATIPLSRFYLVLFSITN